MKLVDTNIFVHYLSGGPRAGDIEKLLIIHADLVTTLRIVDEAMFVIIRRIVLEKLGIRRLDKLREHIRKHGIGFATDKLRAFIDMLEELDIPALKDWAEPRELLETMEKHNLTPSDAIIAITCRHYGIRTIITFDEDFKQVPWLHVIP